MPGVAAIHSNLKQIHAYQKTENSIIIDPLPVCIQKLFAFAENPCHEIFVRDQAKAPPIRPEYARPCLALCLTLESELKPGYRNNCESNNATIKCGVTRDT